MRTRVAIKQAKFHAFHGYYNTERVTGNTFFIDAEVELSSFDEIEDDIDDTINYEHMYRICKEEMDNTQKLLEKVVLNIILRFKKEFKNIEGGTISLQKVGPQLGGSVEKAIIEIDF